MPVEPFRREIKKEHEQPFKERSAELGHHWNIENTRPESGRAPIPRRTLDPKELADLSKTLTHGRDRLRHLDTHRVRELDETQFDPWRERARASREDLAGYWNDLRLQIAERRGRLGAGDPERARQNEAIDRALDWLERADREGGLSEWLGRWRDAIATDKSKLSWEELAYLADRVGQGIIFCTQMVESAFGELAGAGVRAELQQALDSIAWEISRQIDAFNGKEPLDVAGRPFDVIKDRLRGESLRAGTAERLYQTLHKAKDKLGDACVKEIDASLQKSPEVQSFARSIDKWQSAARDVAEHIALGHAADPDALGDAALTLESASSYMYNKMYDVVTMTTNTNDILLDTTRANSVGFVVRRVASEAVARLETLAKSLPDDAARSLLEGKGIPTLKELAAKESNVRGIYEFMEVFAKGARIDPVKAPFGEPWRQASTQVLNEIGTSGKPDHNPALAKVFQDGFASGELAGLLDRWAARPPGDTYGLGWQLVVKLRNYKYDLEMLFAKAPRYQQYLRYTLDALSEVVARDLDRTPGAG